MEATISSSAPRILPGNNRTLSGHLRSFLRFAAESFERRFLHA